MRRRINLMYYGLLRMSCSSLTSSVFLSTIFCAVKCRTAEKFIKSKDSKKEQQEIYNSDLKSLSS